MKAFLQSYIQNFSFRRYRTRNPIILLLVDREGGAFDNSAREIARQLRNDFTFAIAYAESKPKLSHKDYDLIYVFFGAASHLQQLDFEMDRTIKEASSHRWGDDARLGPCTPEEMVNEYLGDAGTVICASRRLVDAIQPYHRRVFHTPNGINPKAFKPVRKRRGPLTIGWAGNIKDPARGVSDIVKPACEGRSCRVLAPGGLSNHVMNKFYNSVDVIVVASGNEGESLTLLEGMAAGCFPVCADVGIVPELVRNGENGLIVRERTIEAFRSAFEWCDLNVEDVRRAGRENAAMIHRQRNWKLCAENFKSVFLDTLNYARRARFRNDDVSADTCLERFQQFCAIFAKYGIQQLHGITLRGRTNSYFNHDGGTAEYEGLPNIGELPNGRIRDLSAGLRFEDREDLIAFLRESPDEIALHGLYHTDYSAMTALEQREDIKESLELLRKLFPKKRIRYFIAPFNRTNDHTREVAAEFGLTVLAADGVHLEEALHHLQVQPETWYRYHHHRFYPESTFPHWHLSLDALEKSLARNFHSPLTVDRSEINQSSERDHSSMTWVEPFLQSSPILRLTNYLRWKRRGLQYRAGLLARFLHRKAATLAIHTLTRAQCRQPKLGRPRIGMGWTGDVVGGVKNHLLAIRRHSSIGVSILPLDVCIGAAASAGLTMTLPETVREKDLARFDILHSHVEPFFIRLCAQVARRGIPWVHTYHTVYFSDDWRGGLAAWQQEINQCLLETASHADVRVSVSRWLQAHLRERHGIETLYIPNGVDTDKCRRARPERFAARYGLRPFALFVGSSDDIKNPQAFVRLAGCFPAIDFVMIGRRLDRESLQQKTGSDLPGNLRVLGPLPHEGVLDAIAACRVFVMTSRSEGLPTVMMEAMALGKPVVGCNRFGVQEVIGDERYGFIYDFENMSDLQHQFRCALEDGTRGCAARARVETEYAWPGVIKKLDVVYRGLLK
jgi:glycosyltransferase involved in cell wall biosynthesis